MLVTNFGSNNVSVISGSTHAVLGTVQVGRGPFGVASDDATGVVYVSNGYQGTISIIGDFQSPQGPASFGLSVWLLYGLLLSVVAVAGFLVILRYRTRKERPPGLG